MLKIPGHLSAALRAEFVEKFAVEARTIAQLDHPAIVKVLDFGACAMPAGGTAPWMILDWLDGVTLDAELAGRRGGGGRSPAECLSILRPIIEATAAAHHEGVAHRDLKPSNIMLVRGRRGETSARLLDFGIAKIMRPSEQGASSGHTATATLIQAFSLHYVAAEQLTGTRTGPWTDVHALGMILTEMLTDASPLRGEDTTDLYAEALSPVRPTPAKFGVDVGAWEAVLARGVAIRPSERPPDASALLEALLAEVPAGRRASFAPTVVSAAMPAPAASTATEVPTTLRPAQRRDDGTPIASRRTHRGPAMMAAGVIVVLASIAGVLHLGARPAAPPSPLAMSLAPPITPVARVAAPEAPVALASPEQRLHADPTPPVVTPPEPPPAPSAPPATRRAAASAPVSRSSATPRVRAGRPPAPTAAHVASSMPLEAVVTSEATPSPAAVQAAMQSVAAPVRRCLAGMNARVPVEVTFAHGGGVQSVRVGSPFGASSAGPCIVQAVLGARVLPFRQGSYTARHLYSFQ